MDIKHCFQVLGIEQTKDEAEIKAAYRSKLVEVRPEENQEGFKRLREAYEGALTYVKKEDTMEEMAEHRGPVKIFLSRLDQLYRTLPRRLHTEQWEELLQEEILEDLELGEEIKWEMFTYLENHYYLPVRIWELLCSHFHISDNEQEFKEHLPVNFVDFILQKAAGGVQDSFPLEKLSGAEQADYDGFIQDFNVLLKMLEENPQQEQKEEWLKNLGEKIAGMDTYGISHPWYELEKAKLELLMDRKEEAEARLLSIWSSREGDERLLLGGARILNACGKQEEAEAIFRELAEQERINGNVHAAMIELIHICLDREALEEAKEYGEKAREIYASQEVMELLADCNTRLIEYYTLPGRKLAQEEAIRLAQCYLQTGREKEALIYFQEKPLLTADTAECHQIKAVLFFSNQLNREALEEIYQWRGRLPERKEADEPELARSFELEGRTLMRLYLEAVKQNQEKESEEAADLKMAARAAFEKAIQQMPQNINFLMAKMLFLGELKEYEEMKELCEQIIQADSRNFWAYYYLQEAHEALGNAQEVIDTFYQAKELYAGWPKIYERAVKVFLYYNQHREAESILRQAEEAGVDSPFLKVKRVEVREKTISSPKEQIEADHYAGQIIDELERLLKAEDDGEEEATKADLEKLLAEAYMERVYIHEKEQAGSVRKPDEMELWLMRAIELDDCLWNRYYLGRFYVVWKVDKQAAYRNLKQCEERGMEFGWLDYFLGRSLDEAEDLLERDKAIEYYKKAYEKLPESNNILWRIVSLYRGKFDRTGQEKYVKEALNYSKAQIEAYGADYYDHWQLSRIYRRIGRMEEAIAEMDFALEKRCTAFYLDEKAFLLELSGRTEEAIELYERAIKTKWEETKEGDYDHAYTRMYRIFSRTKQYCEGIRWFEASLSTLRSKEQLDQNLEHIKQLYFSMEDWENALKVIERRYGSISLNDYGCQSWQREGERIEDILEVYSHSLSGEELKQKAEEAVRLLENKEGERLEDDAEGKYGAWEMVKNIYTDCLLDDERGLLFAYKELEQGERIGKDSSEYQGALSDIMGCLWRLGKARECKRYRLLYQESLSLGYRECAEKGKSPEELHLENSIRRRVNLYSLFLLAFFSEENEKAREYCELLANADWCWDCCQKECVEEFLAKGYMALYDGKEAEAQDYFTRANSVIDGYNDTALRELRRLEQRRFKKETKE